MSVVKCEGELIVEGDISGKRYRFEPSDLSFEEVSREERSMGMERLYQAWLEFTDDAGPESQNVNITLNIWEYPPGTTNHKETDVNGATVVQEINYQIIPE